VQESRLRHFRELKFGADSPSFTVSDILALLPRLSHVNKVSLGPNTLARLWGGPVSMDASSPSTDQAGYAVAAFDKLRSLIELHTEDVDLSTLLPLFRNNSSTLRTLRCTVNDPPELNVVALAQVLSATTHLDDLRLFSFDDDESEEPFDLSLPQQTMAAVPPLRRLSISSLWSYASHVPFAHCFASTLTSLELVWTYDTQAPAIPAILTTETFPLVDTLSLSSSGAMDLIASIKPRHFPRLTTLELRLAAFAYGTRQVVEPLLRPFSSFNSLTTLHIPGFAFNNKPSQDAITSFCTDNSVALSPRGLNDPILPLASASNSALSPRSPTYPSTLAVAENVKGLMEYLQDVVDRASKEGNEGELKRVQTVLKPIELEKEAAEVWRKV
jgi:hypothetical protein